MLLYEISFFYILIALVVNKEVLGDDSSEVSDRIINGREVKLGERPYQVSLQDPHHFCGGTIINNAFILSAAHCLVGKTASKLKVVVGTIDLKKPYATYYARKIIVNNKYSQENSFKNDIALIKVTKLISFNARVQPVHLPVPGLRLRPGTPVVVSGWGRINNGSQTNTLQEVLLQITNQDKCRKAVQAKKFNLYNTQLCADDNDPSTRSGDCNGDSGGPLTLASQNVIVGIVSWSIKDPSCGSNKYPNIYTRVSDYIDWIRSNVR